MKNSFLLNGIAGVPLSVSAFADNGATGIIKERVDNLKASQMAKKNFLVLQNVTILRPLFLLTIR